MGATAQGAVLNTASQAALRGLPSDRSRGRYVGGKHHYEQYTTAHLPTAPGVGQQVTLTKIDLIK